MMKTVIFLIIIFFTVPVYGRLTSDDDFYLARKAYFEGLYESSITLFEKFIRSHPESKQTSLARIYLGRVLYLKKNYLKAEEVLSKVVAGGADGQHYDEGLYWFSKTKFALREYDAVVEYAEKLITQFPSSDFVWPAYQLLAHAFKEQHRYEEAEDVYEKIIEESQDLSLISRAYTELLDLYYQQGKYNLLQSTIERYLASYPQGALKAQMYFYRAQVYSRNGDYAKAIEDFTQALFVVDGGLMRDLIYEKRGLCYLERDDFLNAEKDFSRIKGEKERLFAFGIYYLKKGEYNRALDSFTAFIKNYPYAEEISFVYLNQAECFYQLGRIKDAFYSYKYVVDNFDDFSHRQVLDKAYYGLGWCYLKKGDFKEAVRAFTNTAVFSEDEELSLNSLLQIAHIYVQQKRFNDALKQYSKIIKRYPDNKFSDYIEFQKGKILMLLKKWEKAAEVFALFVERYPSSKFTASALYYLGKSYFYQGRYSRASGVFRKFVEEYPLNDFCPSSYYFYGKSLAMSNHYDDALNVFRVILRKVKDKDVRKNAYLEMAEIYYKQGDYRKAKDVWIEFLESFSTSPQAGIAYFYLGNTYEREHKFELAEHFYKKAQKYALPKEMYPHLIIHLGIVYLMRGEYAEAEKLFLSYLDTSRYSSDEIKFYLAEALVVQGKVNKALAIYKELFHKDTSLSKRAMRRAAFILKEQKKYKAAEELFEKVLDKGEGGEDIYFSLAECKENLGKYKEAIADYYRLIYNTKDNHIKVRAYLRIGKVYERQNNIVAAKEAYREAISFDVKESKIARLKLEELEEMN